LIRLVKYEVGVVKIKKVNARNTLILPTEYKTVNELYLNSSTLYNILNTLSLKS